MSLNMITRSMARKKKAEGDEKALESESLTPKAKTPRKLESLKKVRIRLSESICMFPDKKIAETREGGVYEGELRLGDFSSLAIVVKLVAKNEENLKEARLLAKLKNHSHVISLIESGFYHTDVQSSIYIALDKCHNENLREYVTNRKNQGIPFDLNKSTEIVNQIITGVEYIHDKKIIHKDLKPDNILFFLDQKLIKIADFGLSEEIDSVSAEVPVKGQFGTKGYRPPESFGNSIISQKTDIFSLGIIFYYIFSNGEHPFGDDCDIWNYNTKNGIIIDLSKLLVPNPKTTKHLIKCMIETKLNDRPTIWQVSQHPCWSRNEVECNFDFCCDEASNAPTYEEEETLCLNLDDLWKLVEILQQRTCVVKEKVPEQGRTGLDPKTGTGTSVVPEFSAPRVSVERCMETLIHACQCRDALCSLRPCLKMKKVLCHTKNCKRKSDGSCLICKQLIALCYYHAKVCQVERCGVAYCVNIKIKLREQARRTSETVRTNSAQDGPGAEKQQLVSQSVAGKPEQVGPQPQASTSRDVQSRVPTDILPDRNPTSVNVDEISRRIKEAAAASIKRAQSKKHESQTEAGKLEQMGPQASTSSEMQTQYSLAPLFTEKKWQKDDEGEVRSEIVTKIVQAIFPTPLIVSLEDERMKKLVAFARRVEGDMFDQANSRSEYYHLLAEKIYKIQKELEEKRAARRRARAQQQILEQVGQQASTSRERQTP